MEWRKGLTKYVEKVDCPNYRLQATKFKFPEGHILLINCYMPCDPQSDQFDDTEVVGVLGDIRSLMLSSNCEKIILVGDLNSHFDRYSRFTNIVADNLDDL